jgi:hypothetical protein
MCDASIMSALIYEICSIGGVVVVVEHICDETNRAVWLALQPLPPTPPFDDVRKVVDEELGVSDGVVVEDVTEFRTRMFVRAMLAFC